MIGRILAVSAAVLVAAGAVTAAQAARGRDRGEGGRPGLDLTEAQKTAMRECRESGREEMKTARERLQTEVRALRGVMEGSNPSDAAISAAVRKVRDARTALQQARQGQQEKMAAILTPRQQAQMILGMADRMERRGERAQGRAGRARGGEDDDEEEEDEDDQGSDRRRGGDRWRSGGSRGGTW